MAKKIKKTKQNNSKSLDKAVEKDLKKRGVKDKEIDKMKKEKGKGKKDKNKPKKEIKEERVNIKTLDLEKKESKKKSTDESKKTNNLYNSESYGTNANLYYNYLDGADSRASNLTNFGIFNLPHQFTREADPRMGYNDWKGRAYTQHILYNTPQVIFKVGKPRYMKGNGENSQNILANILSMDDDNDKGRLLDQAFGGGENETYYYTFEDDFDNYCKYVNAMVRYVAVKLGVAEFKSFNLEDTKFRNDSWFTDFFAGGLGLTKYLSFYVEANSTSVSESGSNSTGESQLAGGIKNMGATKRELDFLFGAKNRAQTEADTGYNQYAEQLSKSFTGLDGLDAVINKLGGVFTSIATGANILFPEIWNDSSYRTNYSVEIRLTSPYGSKYAIMQNIFIPFLCLLAMALPRQSWKQGYTGPFLVQCFSKGWFSCNTGMIESIDVKKGGSSGKEWTIDDLPTEITVSLQIKDLYPTMMATSLASSLAFANNLGLTNYLKTLAGVQLIDFDPMSNIEEIINTFVTGVTDIPINIYGAAQRTIGGGAKNLITKIFRGLN